MQITDSVRYVDGGANADTAGQEHPVGEVTLGAGGALGLRGRLLRTAELDTAATVDVPFTTGTITLA
ncbi:hypothetical protein [Streptomyces sp. NPDC005017]|uniref:hypothetical protein n=1 Tax=Streptomyces sp. NPDC005017 TaxID=3364706 RepID=UPI0036B9E228